ncbi:farnesol dehydrogenase-like isoform X4 [Eupeodes corollae]|uniref:farnesol dehydrogenase-like isoform X4 n=1 Tax=Eupeodes corollae TaxID=290404 RepID=UPI0024937852|nr:farnesol dehydrogenase-like isoform X4 [Eupeodes corollae]
MDRWQNRVAVVTGASSGIGEAIAKDLVAAGLRVVALARREDRLDKIRSELPSDDVRERFFVKKCDITKEDDVKTTFEWIEQTLGGTDILVNNAGTTRPGNLVEIDMAVMDEVLNINVRGLIYCTQAAFKSMKARNFDGHIVHINSIAGHNVPITRPGLSYNIYPPTKFAVTAINEVMRNELRDLGTKIKTTSISPGITKTEIAPPELYDLFDALLMPEDVSQAVLFCIATPPHVQIHEMVIKPVGEIV